MHKSCLNQMQIGDYMKQRSELSVLIYSDSLKCGVTIKNETMCWLSG